MADASVVDPVEENIDENDDGADAELEAMKQRVKEMEAEAAKLRELQADADREDSTPGSGGRAGSSTPAGAAAEGVEGAEAMDEDKEDVDGRSVYIGNVDYASTPEEIQSHFAACGQINRVTILCDKFTGHPKGYAYVEFSEAAFVQNAMILDDSVFRGRQLKVTPKRTNVPGFNRGGRGGRGRGRGIPRGGYGFQQPRGRGAYRGRGRGY
ncbi:hypothetical protein BDY24DRAFT_366491 [Mrakia frigida]|uniref:polyadenylate-binding protein n=1 Tax=Mrakia frigida TaxID=29902 RepID=UPI003FCC02FE